MTDTAPPRLDRSAARGWPAVPAAGALLMGVLNLTPNSFSDGGDYTDVASGLTRARAIAAEGADILDIGGESTHPSAAAVSEDDEIARVIPALTAIAAEITLPVSIDTYKARTARAALEAGASIVNDVWGLQREPDIAHVAADFDAGVCIMHNRAGFDPARDVFADMQRFFDTSLAIAARAGIAGQRIVLDPGIGFGKTFDQNLMVLNRLGELAAYGFPLLVGCSRKGFIGKVTGRPEPKDRLFGSIAAHVVAVHHGARIIRAHDIAAHKDALALTAAIARETTETGDAR